MKRILKRVLIAAAAIAVLLCLSSVGAKRPAQDIETEDERIQIYPPVTETQEPQSTDFSAPDVTDSPQDIPETIKPTMIDPPEPTPLVFYHTEEETLMLARLLYSECRGVESDTEKACVVWTVLNRVDSDNFAGDTIQSVLTQKGQFAYNSSAPVWEHLHWLAADVLWKWTLERNGHTDVGRVLPNNYFWFSGDGQHNYFRDTYETYKAHIWDYSLESPYEN